MPGFEKGCRMKRMFVIAIGLVLLVGVFGCAARQPVQTIMVPPRVDLAPHQMIGVMEFDSDTKGKLASFATRRFVEMARRDQGVLRVMDLGPGRSALRTAGQKAWSPALYKTVGEKHGVKTVFLGELSISNIRPGISLAGALRSGEITAEVDATLAVNLVETATGASLWSGSARLTRSIGHLSVFRGGDFVFDAEDPEEAYGDFVDALVERVTRDFRATWVRR